MKYSKLFAILLTPLLAGLTACAGGSAAVVVPTATPLPVSLLTNPTQAAVEAANPPPTFTPAPPAPPPPTSTTLPPTPTLTPPPPAAASATPEPAPQVQVNPGLSTAVNVRSGPGTVYPVVGQAQPGQSAAVTGRNAAQDWWQIELAGLSGWIYGGLVTFSGNAAAVAVAQAPPPPPTATPAPAAAATEAAPPETTAELADTLRCGQNFCVTYQAMVPIWENGGCIGNHSIYVTVLEGPPPGRPMDGVVVGDTFNNVEVASGDKGPGTAEVTLWMNSMTLKVKRHIDGTPFTSEESFNFTSHDELIPAELLAAMGYCDGSVENCRWAQQNNQVCRGHYSWRVTFHKFD